MRNILLSVLLIASIGFSSAACNESREVQLSSCDAECRKDVEAKALAGDIEAARRSVTNNLYASPSEVRFWTQIGAENGDVEAQRSLAIQLLLYSESQNDHIRGLFWLGKAAAGGSVYAKEELARYRQGGREAINPDPRKINQSKP
jgi:TPR repeat protein